MAILPVAFCPRMGEPVVIDGRLEEDLWKTAPAIPFFVRPRVRWIPEAQTQVFTAYDDEALAVAFRCFDDAPERIEAAAGPPRKGRRFFDDHVGVRLWTDGNENQSSGARHFVLTAAGRLYEEAGLDSGRFEEVSFSPCAAGIGAGEWTVEARLPFERLRIRSPKPGDRWGFAAYRRRVGSRFEGSGWIEVGRGPYGELLPGWLLFESVEETEGRRTKAVEPYLRRFVDLLETRARQAEEAEAKLPAGRCPVTRYRVGLMIRSLSSIKNDMMHAYHPDALRHYAQILQFNFGRLDELIETLRQGEDPYSSADGYVFLGTKLETDQANHAFAVLLGRAYDSSDPHPLFVCLHGMTDDWIADSRAHMALAWPPELDFVMVFPSGVGLNRRYRLAAEDEVFAVIREARRRFSIDPRRTVLVGFGAGGAAAVRLASRCPGEFSAVAALGAVPSLDHPLACPLFYWTGRERGWSGPLETMEDVTRIAGAEVAPEGESAALTPKIVQTLAGLSVDSMWRIDIRAAGPRYGRCQWARIDRWVDYSRPARLRLETDEDGRITAEADNVGAFSLLPEEGPFVAGQGLSVLVDGRVAAAGQDGAGALTVDLTPPPQGPLVKHRGLSVGSKGS
ncbi:MAG: hypothetical protein NTW86_18360 [Candidatus Sumerlaeota bacterium]|nr:hypothetical protein [Candidatus Sumerlaeota bacterium]